MALAALRCCQRLTGPASSAAGGIRRETKRERDGGACGARRRPEQAAAKRYVPGGRDETLISTRKLRGVFVWNLAVSARLKIGSRNRCALRSSVLPREEEEEEHDLLLLQPRAGVMRRDRDRLRCPLSPVAASFPRPAFAPRARESQPVVRCAVATKCASLCVWALAP
eukprot:532328-Prymnesium_polylepis.1